MTPEENKKMSSKVKKLLAHMEPDYKDKPGEMILVLMGALGGVLAAAEFPTKVALKELRGIIKHNKKAVAEIRAKENLH